MVSEKVSLVQRFSWIFNTLFHEVYAVITVYIFWILFYNSKLEITGSWHFILSTLAYVPLMGEAIILFSSDNVYATKMERTTKGWIHGATLFVSAILVTIGIAFMIDEKGPGANHFTSKHGWTGLVSWIFVLLSQCFGICAMKAQSFSKIIRPVYIKFTHNLLGIIGYIFGVVSLGYGLETGAFRSYSSLEARTAMFYLLGITAVWSVLAALKSAYNQLKTIIS